MLASAALGFGARSRADPDGVPSPRLHDLSQLPQEQRGAVATGGVPISAMPLAALRVGPMHVLPPRVGHRLDELVEPRLVVLAEPGDGTRELEEVVTRVDPPLVGPEEGLALRLIVDEERDAVMAIHDRHPEDVPAEILPHLLHDLVKRAAGEGRRLS